MDSNANERIRDLFHRLADLSPVQRAVVLDQECAGEPALRGEVEELLRQDTRTGRLRVPPIAERLRQSDVPEQIGPYRILARLGEGGFGEVYVAQQAEPLRRRVALKIMKAGLDTKALLGRFDAERQVLALLDHPNIAKIHDAGSTERGRPYFVMELVEGEPITHYCDSRNLPVPERLALFASVCRAVHHAHQRGVIHRDIKPSNVLVAEADGKPLAKVIDFGVAKAIGQSLAEHTLFTAQGQLIGTPEYMSPEQANLDGQDVDIRTDVYSLGVLLYELLTGSLPLEPSRLRELGLTKIVEMVREEDPPKPSSRVSSAGEPAVQWARLRGTDRKRLSRLLRSELDWIVMKALEKDRARRYESANALALDVERYTRNEPVDAGPPSTIYRVRKLTRRYRLALAVAGVVALSILYALFESNRQRVVAEKARDEAEAVTDFLSDMLRSVDPRKRGRDTSVLELLDEGAKSINEEFPDQPLVRAHLMQTMGLAYTRLGELKIAGELIGQALAIREAAYGPDHEEVAYTLNSLGILAYREGDYERARGFYQRALAAWEKSLGPEAPNVTQALNNLANAYWALGELDQALPMYERALAIREKIRGADHPDVAQTLNNLGGLHQVMGDVDEARACFERSLAIREKTLRADHPDIAQSLHNLGVLLSDSETPMEAVDYFERALAIQERTLGPEDSEVALTLINMGSALAEAGENDKARTVLGRALEIQGANGNAEHPYTALPLSILGRLDEKSGDDASARTRYRKALSILEGAGLGSHTDALVSLRGLARLERAGGDDAAADQLEARVSAIEGGSP